ncbi:MipA/OmpV family protein [Aliihoeflea aestuarii]|jgi:MipA family protein|uniref:MipA/OmpV family protein n=1 Tax=Aliihoeflea aestuarii TaxID=453840 RepID=UPI002093B94E|nr:MipA/OmpV family protein [Aliihoeflea aestuarii]MCO6389696.1 MipA/OmpV family protein [Aliihoeflea aestuarii]
MKQFVLAGSVFALVSCLATPSLAQQSWFSGDWSLTLGVAAISSPEYEGDDKYRFYAQPIVSFGRQGTERRFSSRNDNISIGLIDTGTFRAGPAGKLVFERDGDDSDDLIGLDPIRFGAELGAFAEVYPTDWLRLRGEVRHGVRSHDGIVADVSADAFMNLTPTVQISAGPRVSMASSDYFEAYYGVSATQSLASGLTPYTPDGGFRSVGVGAAIKWDVTDKIETSLFGEYSRLVGPAADSSLVRERGDENQFLIGVSATYRFDFSL